MKIEQLKLELLRQSKIKRDIVVPSRIISMEKGKIILSNLHTIKNLFNGHELEKIEIQPNRLCVNQITDKLDISRTFQNRMLKLLPNLYDHNVNELLKLDASRTFLLRTFTDGTGRAFLSNSFKIIDNLESLNMVLDAISKVSIKLSKNIQVIDCCLSEKRMYCRFCVDSEVSLHNYGPAKAGFILSNSEVGHGKLLLAPMVTFGAKGYIWYKEKYQKTHLGTKLPTGVIESSTPDLSDEFASVIEKFCHEDFLKEKVNELTSFDALGNPLEVIKKACKSMGIDDIQKVVACFSSQGQSESPFDVVQAINEYSKLFDCDKKFHVECKLIELIYKLSSFDK